MANCQDPALTTPYYLTGNVGSVLWGKLVITLPAYSRAARSHTSGVLTRLSSSRGIRHAWRGLVAVLSPLLRGLVVLVVSVTPGVVSSQSSHTPLRGLVVLIGVVVAAPVHG